MRCHHHRQVAIRDDRRDHRRQRRSNSGSITRSARNWASWSRRRDLEDLGMGGELGLDDPLAEIGRLVGDLAEPGAQRPEDQADHAQDDHRPAQQCLELVDHAPERLEEGHGVDDQEEHEEDRRRARAASWRAAGGVDDRGAQAVEEHRRGERALEIGEEVDDVEAALDQMAQVVGGEGHGLGRALLAVRSPACG